MASIELADALAALQVPTKDASQTFTGLDKFTGGMEAHRSLHANNAQGIAIGDSAGANDVSDSVNIGFFTGAGPAASGAQAVRMGRHAGYNSGSPNAVLIGHAPAQYAPRCSASVIIGYLAGRNLAGIDGDNGQTSFEAVIIGHEAATDGMSNESAVVVGSQAAKGMTSGIGAVVLGYDAGSAAVAADYSVMVGREAGTNATSAQGSVLVGYQAGKDLSRDYTLVIEGHPTYAPNGNTGLIYGEFDNRYLRVNGRFGCVPGSSVTPVINGEVTFELTSNTTLKIKAKGSDGTVRSGTITLA